MAPALMVGVLGAQGLWLVDDQLRSVAVWLLSLQSLPLLMRSRFPWAVLVVTAVAAVVQVLLGMPATNATVGQAVATVSVVSRLGWPWSLVPPAAVLVLNAAAAWVGGLPELGRHVLITGVSLVVAWAVGDAAGRRAAVETAAENELVVRAATAQWRTQLVASEERLRIAQELHQLVGEALDAIVVHAGAARLRPSEVGEHLVVIESIARDVLGKLDRFLSLLRRGTTDVAATAGDASAPPVALSAGYRLPRRLALVVGAFGNLGPVVVLMALAATENFAVPPTQRPADVWVVLLTVAATAPLALRRRRPRIVAAVVCAASAVQLLIAMPVGNQVLAVAVAAHAIAVQHGWRKAVAWGLGSTGILVVLGARLDSPDALELGVVVVIMVLGAVYIGDATRVAREHDASLQGRIAAVQNEGRLREQAAVAAERTQAARDLHDSIGHTMSLIVLQCGVARMNATTNAGDTAERAAGVLVAIERAARGALGEMDVMLEIVAAPEKPPQGPGAPPKNLSGLVADVRSAGTPVHVRCDDTAELPPGVRTGVYRLVQEALTNVMKHAPGATAIVSVQRHGGDVEVAVTNTAAPGRTEKLPSGSRGLVGMQERVARLGGELSAGPEGHGGFSVHAVLPVNRPVQPVRPDARVSEGTT